MQQVTTVIINFQTPNLTEHAVASFRRHCPDEQLLLIDNGSHDQSVELFKRLITETPQSTSQILNKYNLHHGPAMDQALRHLLTPFALFIDSDCEVRRGGFIEPMLAALAEKHECYIIGKQVFMNTRGFDVPRGPAVIPYIRPSCMLVKRDLYLSLPPFKRHGTPCLANMKRATERGLILLDFPIADFIHHEGRGTAGRFGYNLGWRGKWNYLLHKLGL